MGLNAWKAKRKKHKTGQIVFATVMLAIPVLQYIVFYIGVNFNSILMAFQVYERTSEGWVSSFAGLHNFAEVFDKIFGKDAVELKAAFGNSFKLCFMNLFLKTPIALLFSYYICKKLFLHKAYRTVLFLPNIISAATLVIMFKYFVDGGLLQYTGEGLIANQNRAVLVFYWIWSSLGITVLVYSNAMGKVDASIVESARLDGAGPAREFISIYLPIIFPSIVTFIVSTLSAMFIDQMNLFSFYTNYANTEHETIGYYLYRQTQRATIGGEITKDAFPLLSAFGLLLTFICAPITLGMRALLMRVGGKE
ncbi:MAG: sugar ABC transporter permease [Clostridia bacterium]|nr:sugar ABC transporter permease [Clostridia bacterium]